MLACLLTCQQNQTSQKHQIFNVGKYRRQAYAAAKKVNGDKSEESGACDASFFDASNSEAAALREKVAYIALQDMVRWLDSDAESDDSEEQEQPKKINRRGSSSSLASAVSGDPRARDWGKDKVAIFDATNSTAKRRQWVLEELTLRREGKNIGVGKID